MRGRKGTAGFTEAQSDVPLLPGNGSTVKPVGPLSGEHVSDFEVFDFEVEGLHNFYVRGEGSDAAGVLVHNSSLPKQFRNSNVRAAQKGFPGIGLTKNGGPTFAGTKYLYNGAPRGPIQKVQLTGSRALDFDEANKLAGLESTPAGYTWHHVDDFDPGSGTATLQLVKTDAHKATYPHRGSVSQWEHSTGHGYTD